MPATGYRANTTGALLNVGANGHWWSSSSYASGNINAGSFFCDDSRVNPLNNDNRANGFSVRCVQHPNGLFPFFGRPDTNVFDKPRAETACRLCRGEKTCIQMNVFDKPRGRDCLQAMPRREKEKERKKQLRRPGVAGAKASASAVADSAIRWRPFVPLPAVHPSLCRSRCERASGISSPAIAETLLRVTATTRREP